MGAPDTRDPVAEAVARGDADAAALVRHRDALFPHLVAIFWIVGAEHLHACVAGAAQAVIVAKGNLDRAEEARRG